ncbi:MAG TPA: hypothetical protein VFI12_05970, partial [Thermomicrobiales bacterium]|nr:hypothetical protein [Thermomicrobiales bacterium]
LVLLSLLATLYLLARRWAAPLPAALLAAAALFVSEVNLSMRPQIISFLLIAITTAAWLRTREDQSIRWWLIPLTWLWAMTHGMWPIGIGIGFVAVAGLAMDRALPRHILARASLVPFLSAVGAALTPTGPALYGAVLAVNDRKQYFSEWASPNFSNPGCVVLGILLALGATLMIRRTDRTVLSLGLFLVAAMCAVWSWRTVPVSAMILVPLVARQIPAGTLANRRERFLIAGVSALALAALAVAVPRTASDPPSQPAWLDPALSALPAGTKVVDSSDYGGYLMWRYPQLDLLSHGYGDTFTVAELQRNVNIATLAPGWDRELRMTGCTVAILRPTSTLGYALIHEEHWIVLHRSATVAELRAPAGWLTTDEHE